MNTVFAFEIAVSHRAANGDRSTVNASVGIRIAIDQVNRIVAFLGPLRVHPQHHLGPVVGIGSAIASVDGQDRAARIVGSVEQCFEFKIVKNDLQLGNFGFDFGDNVRIFFGHFLERIKIFAGGQKFLHRSDDRLERFQLPDGLLSSFLIVPKVGGSHSIFDFSRLLDFGIVVKESLAAG